MIEAYLNNEYIRAHVYFVVITSCIVLVWQAIMIYLNSDRLKSSDKFSDTISNHSRCYDSRSDIDYIVCVTDIERSSEDTVLTLCLLLCLKIGNLYLIITLAQILAMRIEKIVMKKFYQN